YYAGETREKHYEEIMPSGRLLIDDPRCGWRIRRYYSRDFDWQECAPIGPALVDREVMCLQTGGGKWYVSVYQEGPNSSALYLVEEHEGNTFKRRVEIEQGDKGTDTRRGSK